MRHFHSCLLFGAIFIALSGCVTRPKLPDHIPNTPASPKQGITYLRFDPAAYAVLGINEKLHVQFGYDLPESPCQIFMHVSQPLEYSVISEHGFTLGSSACPGLISGRGLGLNQSVSISYSAKRDQHGPESMDFPPYVRVTNLFFTVYGGSIGIGDNGKPYFKRDQSIGRKIYSVPIDVTWKLEKKTGRQTQQEIRLAQWEKVLEIHPDATLPVFEKKSRKKASSPAADDETTKVEEDLNETEP